MEDSNFKSHGPNATKQRIKRQWTKMELKSEIQYGNHRLRVFDKIAEQTI
jgi:hypothetical protein